MQLECLLLTCNHIRNETPSRTSQKSIHCRPADCTRMCTDKHHVRDSTCQSLDIRLDRRTSTLCCQPRTKTYPARWKCSAWHAATPILPAMTTLVMQLTVKPTRGKLELFVISFFLIFFLFLLFYFLII